jgi:hypothetical protein
MEIWSPYRMIFMSVPYRMKIISIVYMGHGETGQYSCMSFHMVQKCQACKEKWWCFWTFQVCHNIKECLLNVKKPQKYHIQNVFTL